MLSWSLCRRSSTATSQSRRGGSTHPGAVKARSRYRLQRHESTSTSLIRAVRRRSSTTTTANTARATPTGTNNSTALLSARPRRGRGASRPIVRSRAAPHPFRRRRSRRSHRRAEPSVLCPPISRSSPSQPHRKRTRREPDRPRTTPSLARSIRPAPRRTRRAQCRDTTRAAATQGGGSTRRWWVYRSTREAQRELSLAKISSRAV